MFDVAANRDSEGANVLLFKKHGAVNQQFDILYLDEMKSPLSTGDFDPDFGFYCNREFSVISKMAGKKYIDTIGDNLVLKSRSTTTTQKWMYDIQTRTIINPVTKLAWDIAGEGKETNVQVHKSSSSWW